MLKSFYRLATHSKAANNLYELLHPFTSFKTTKIDRTLCILLSLIFSVLFGYKIASCDTSNLETKKLCTSIMILINVFADVSIFSANFTSLDDIKIVAIWIYQLNVNYRMMMQTRSTSLYGFSNFYKSM